MKSILTLTLLIGISSILAGCAYFHSANSASFEKNQCINLKRELMFSNNQYGRKEVSQVKNNQMQLRGQYQKLNCDKELYSK